MDKNKTKQPETVKAKSRELVGLVVSTKNLQTVIVQVEHMHRHPLYKKAVRKTKRFAAHNEMEGVVVGDTVRIVEIKPMSKTKHFRVVEKVAK